MVKEPSGTTKRGSKKSSTPKPSQVGHAPKGALNENNLGSISDIVKPDVGHANFSENVRICLSSESSSTVSTIEMPSAKSNAVRKLSANRTSVPFFTTIRSTTTSIECLNFLSSTGGSSKLKYSPFTLTLWKPSLTNSKNSFRYSPFRSRIIGARR